jgi:hypothetical protein
MICSYIGHIPYILILEYSRFVVFATKTVILSFWAAIFLIIVFWYREKKHFVIRGYPELNGATLVNT